MKITEKHEGTVVREMDVDVSPEQLRAWANGANMRETMPHLSMDELAMVSLLGPFVTRPGLAEAPWFVYDVETDELPEPINPEGDRGPNYLPDPDLDS